jgi:(p)ppGpp synthase/HD superfamily hydrolase
MDKIVIEALKFGAYKHRYQLRRFVGGDPIPYFNHCIDVMYILGFEAEITDADILSTALLHDTIEDTETTIEELAATFGPKITELVLELSDDQSVSTAERYEAQIWKTPSYSYGAKLVKLADRIANIRDFLIANIPGWTEERRFGHFLQSRKQVDLLKGTHSVLEELYDREYARAKIMMLGNSV